MENMQGQEIIRRIRNIQNRMRSTGRSSMTRTSQELESACKTLGIVYEPVLAAASSMDILDAIRQQNKCQTCTLKPAEAADCVCVGVDFAMVHIARLANHAHEDKHIYSNDALID